MDPATGRWDDSTCTSKSRCVKMDCHEPNTNFQLLGFFKDQNTQEWLNTLTYGEGACIWDRNEYTTMQTDRSDWPEQCTMSNTKLDDGSYLYIGQRPIPQGRIELGLYTNSLCSMDYLGSEKSLEEVMQYYLNKENDEQSNYSFPFEDWNNALDVFKTCQPCVTYKPLADNGNCNNEGVNQVSIT